MRCGKVGQVVAATLDDHGISGNQEEAFEKHSSLFTTASFEPK